MGRIPLVFVLVLVATLASGCAVSLAQGQNTTQPNIVYIVADDMNEKDLQWMPKTKSLIFDEGITYEQAFVTTSQCCPSRVSTLRGQYAHNTGILDNVTPDGGYQTFRDLGHQSDHLGTWLKDSGYATMLAGKYLNDYQPSDPVPPGWSEWYARGNVRYFDYRLNENGTSVHHGTQSEDYFTDVVSEKTTDFIARASGSGTIAASPFFAYVAPVAPHGPVTPAPRHADLFSGLAAPRQSESPAFNEKNVSDKPGWVRNLDRLSRAKKDRIDSNYRGHARTLQAVDEMVEAIVAQLAASGELENTYLVFTADNGWHRGEHRIANLKNSSYEESISVPLAIRGPGIPAGRTTDQLALNTDLAPTFAEIGGAATPNFVDGRSLVATFAQDAAEGTWRTAFLHEFWRGASRSPVPRHDSVRSADAKKYIDTGGFEEFYDLNADPHELESDPSNPAAQPLRNRLDELKACAGESCRAAEDAP